MNKNGSQSRAIAASVMLSLKRGESRLESEKPLMFVKDNY
jgi:hypothetical protein